MTFTLVASLWYNLTEAQAIILNGFLTVLAAIVGVFLGSWLFSGKVRTIESAITASQEAIDGHLQKMDPHLEQLTSSTESIDAMSVTLRGKIDGLDAQFQELYRKLRELADRQTDGQEPRDDQTEALTSDSASSGGGGEQTNFSRSNQPAVPPPSRDQLRASWYRIRDAIEDTATNTDIDGRKRAKYMRIDRRSFGDLIAALVRDGYLVDDRADIARDAHALWQSFRTGRRQLNQSDVARMETFAARFLTAK